MKRPFFLGIIVVLSLHSTTSLLKTALAQSTSAKELIGLREAKRRFGPDIRGTLLIKQSNGGLKAEIAGLGAEVKSVRDLISFEQPDGQGKF